MRAAEEYIGNWKDIDATDGKTYRMILVEHAINAINEARKECIEEAAENAKSEWVRWGEHMGHQVEKKSILSLINKLQ